MPFRGLTSALWLLTLVSLVSCNDADPDPIKPPATGDLEVTTSTSGQSLDPDGFVLSIDGGPGDFIDINATLKLRDVDVGSHEISLSGVSLDCAVSGPNPLTVEVENDRTVRIEFVVRCVTPLSGKIVFRAQDLEAGNSGLYTMNLDGTGRTRLAGTGLHDDSPAVSPDGRRIYFVHSDGGCRSSIQVARADGSDPVSLTGGIAALNGLGLGEPSVSPDGTRLVFSGGDCSGSTRIYRMNIDGTGLVPLTDASTNNFDPEWSPDGLRIAFTSNRDGGDYEIYSMNADGIGLTRLTEQALWDGSPTWAPDGTRIAFTTGRENGVGTDIYVMGADGTNPRRVTGETRDYLGGLDWSPDGDRFLYSTFEPSPAFQWRIYLVNADGSGQMSLTNTASRFNETQPIFSP